MNDSCNHDHARWLEAVLVDGPDAAPPGTLAAIRACPRCGPELAELAQVQASFEHTGRVRREALAAVAGRSPSGADEDVATARAVIERHLRPPSRSRWLVFALVAAAVLIALNFALRERPAPEPQPEVHLAPKGAKILSPKGAVEDFELFAWLEPEGGAASYRLRVTESVDGDTVVLHEHTVEGTELHVDAEVLATLPDRIGWELETLNRSGQVVATTYAEAWRVPRSRR